MQKLLILKHFTDTALQLQVVTIMFQNLRSLNSSQCCIDRKFFNSLSVFFLTEEAVLASNTL